VKRLCPSGAKWWYQGNIPKRSKPGNGSILKVSAMADTDPARTTFVGLRKRETGREGIRLNPCLSLNVGIATEGEESLESPVSSPMSDEDAKPLLSS
jgi:hypothetical protein